MIVQCEACQTKFRLADEKVKPGGTKVRCSKCKEIFTVMPPAPEPEPAEETIDFSATNMEKVEDEAPQESPADEPTPEESPEAQAPGQEAPQDSTEVDFSSLEAEMGDHVGMGDELADEFSFADTSQLETAADEGEVGTATEDEPQEEHPAEEQTDFGAAFEESEDTGGDLEFDFSEEAPAEDAATGGDEIDFSDETAQDSGALEFSTDDASETSEFSFESNEVGPSDQEETGEFSFDSDGEDVSEQAVSDEISFGDDNAFSFDEPTEEKRATEEPGEFSFDDENPFENDSSSEWDDGNSADDTSFDFEEPKFDSESADGAGAEPSSEDGGLQFGEIDFAGGDEEESVAPSFEEDDFSKASMELKDEEEEESFAPKRESAPPSRDDDDDDILPPPPPPKKSSLSRILLLLVLLLVILGGAAGYLFVQEGTLNLNTVVRYLPFLKDYIGETQSSAPVERIGINVLGSAYVNGQAGQMLVIQGSAVNNFPSTRSAITVKGVLLDDKGNALLQQTVFCGNRLNDAKLQSMPFAEIEEAMNNQFGDSLSNMNVSAGASIPFTIVFRNLPDGIANINVEVVESKPGAG